MKIFSDETRQARAELAAASHELDVTAWRIIQAGQRPTDEESAARQRLTDAEQALPAWKRAFCAGWIDPAPGDNQRTRADEDADGDGP